MNQFHLSVDSVSDVSPEMQIALNISVLPLIAHIDGIALRDNILSSTELNSIANKTDGKNFLISAPNKAVYEDYFDDLAENYKNILHICQGSVFSDSYKNATAAAKNTMVKYRGRTVYVADSHASSAGLGLLVDSAEIMNGKGLTPENCFIELCSLSEKLEQYVIMGNTSNFNKIFTTQAGILAEQIHSTAMISIDASGKPYMTRKFTGFGTACAYIAKRYHESHSQSPIYVYGSCNVAALLKSVSALRKRGLTDIRMNSMGLINSLTFGKEAIYCAFYGSPEKPRVQKKYSPGKIGDFFEAEE